MRLLSKGSVQSILPTLVCPLMICALITLIAGQSVAQTQRDENLRMLTVTGNGEVRERPDTAEVRLGVETQAATASDARSENASRTQRVIAAIRAIGIPENAIQTSTFQIYPVREYRPGEPQQGEPPIVGYRVTNIVVVRTDNLDRIPRIIDDSIRAGANRVDDVSFMLKDQDAASQEALRRAIDDARRSAETMARALGVRLVRVQTVQEGGTGVIPPPMLFRGGVAMEAAAPTPILPGELTVNASVTITYVIE